MEKLMSITKEQILDEIGKMSVVDITELVSMMEKKFNISSAIATTTNNVNLTNNSEEKTEFNVILDSIGSNKIAIIKIVRSITGLGLKEAKDLVESAPVVIKENISKEDATNLEKTLTQSGASVKIK